MREPLQSTDSLANLQYPDSLIHQQKTWYSGLSDYSETILGLDFGDNMIIYTTLLLFTWLSNTGIVMQLQFKKEVQPGKLVLYSIFIPVALFMILIPILMYIEIWANYQALVITVIASNFFIYFVTKSAIQKKQKLIAFSTKIFEVKDELLKLLEAKSKDGEDTSDKLKELKEELEDFGPKYYNGI